MTQDQELYKQTIIEYEIQKNAEEPEMKKLLAAVEKASKKLYTPKVKKLEAALAKARRDLVEHTEKTYLPEKLLTALNEGKAK